MDLLAAREGGGDSFLYLLVFVFELDFVFDSICISISSCLYLPTMDLLAAREGGGDSFLYLCLPVFFLLFFVSLSVFVFVFVCLFSSHGSLGCKRGK